MKRAERLLGFAVAALVLATAGDAVAASMQGFGRCLKSRGATFYGASWCPHCRAQREALGDAMDFVRYVECSADDGRDTTAACRAARIDGYPTWTFGDGSRVSGKQSLAALSAKTKCELPTSAR